MSAPFCGIRRIKRLLRFNFRPRVSNRAGAFLDYSSIIRGRCLPVLILPVLVQIMQIHPQGTKIGVGAWGGVHSQSLS